MAGIEFDDMARRNAATLIEMAVAEDLGLAMPFLQRNVLAGRMDLAFSEPVSTFGDLTSSAVIPENLRGSASFVTRSEGTISGLPVLKMITAWFGIRWCEPSIADGMSVEAGTTLATLYGPMRSLLLMERTALNFLQRLSGIATRTARYVAAVSGMKSVILDTRKTTPGWRALEKYAVRCGGGTNHRFGLYDAVLIKDNHIAFLAFLGEADPVSTAILQAKAKAPAGMIIEVEVDSLDQFDRALNCHPDIILVDNLGPEVLTEAVRRRDSLAPGVLLEASGGVNLQTVAGLAATGVDRISVGALTHSAPALDIGLDFSR